MGWGSYKPELPDEVLARSQDGTGEAPCVSEGVVHTGKEVKNQCFRTGRALAVQFHLEMTPELIRDWLETSKLSEEEKKSILEESKEKIEEHRKLCKILVNNFISVL